MDSIDQGSIFGGLRSDKYPGIKCFGIILTASCDIAQSKVSKLYYVTAIDVAEWGCLTDTYEKAYMSQFNDRRKVFCEAAKNHDLDPDLLETLDRAAVITICNAEVKSSKKREDLIRKYDTYMLLQRGRTDPNNIKHVVKQDASPLKKVLKDITDGKQFHYYFLPRYSYVEGENKPGGLIVDFQEINWLNIDDVRNIVNPGIDNLILSEYSIEQQENYCKTFWLENDDDYVPYLGRIFSPWREHLMQRFSYCFARIGLQDVTDKDYSGIVDLMTEGL